ncbi:MAG: class E sortase [Acidimicrobiia bacterium]
MNRSSRTPADGSERVGIDLSSAPAARRAGLGASAEFVLEVLRSRAAARRLVSAFSGLLVLVAIGFLAFPLGTNMWAGRVQARLETQFVTKELRVAYVDGEVAIGDSLTRIQIPAISVDDIVVEGTSESALRAGAGHYPSTPLPGEEGNVAIAGHRTTFGKPFANLDKLAKGDEIVLQTPIGTHHYRLSRDPYVVESGDWTPITQGPGSTLTLTTCHPKGSARQRLIIKAELESSSGIQAA